MMDKSTAKLKGMRILYITDRLILLCKILQRGKTGSLQDIGKAMNLSRASVALYMKELKEIGADILYDKKQNTYYFNTPFDFKVQIKKGL